MENSDHTNPLRMPYDGAGDQTESIIDSTMAAYPSLCAALERAGLSDEVKVVITSIVHKAQIVALADALEHLTPVLEAAMAHEPEGRAYLDEMRMLILRERGNYSSSR